MARETPPLSPNLPMVDPETGLPTPFFMRWWQDQIESNAFIKELETPEQVSALFDILGSAAQGDILYRGADTWSFLPAGTADEVLRTAGSGANPSWAGLSGLLDTVLGGDQGMVLYRGSTSWAALAAGTAGQFLQTAGTGANPVWATVASGASTFLTLTDTPASFASNAKKVPWVNTGETALIFTTVSAMIDDQFGSTRGSILYRGASGWTILAPGTSGNFLKTQGAGADPIWDAASGGGSSDFLSLTDTPAAYTNFARDYALAVNEAETDLEFIDGYRWAAQQLEAGNGGVALPFATTYSGSSFATKGNMFTCNTSMFLRRVRFNINDTNTYKLCIAELSDGTSSATITEILFFGPDVTAAGGGTPTVFDAFDAGKSAPHLEAGKHYLIACSLQGFGNSGVNRTEFPTGSWSFSGSELTANFSSRFTEDIPVGGETPYYGLITSSAIRMDIDFWIGEGARTITERIDDEIDNTQGSILYRGSTSWAALAAGTADHVLKTKGAGADPVWEAESGGGGGGLTTFEDPDYTNTGGQGDRTANITVTYSGTVGGGTTSNHVDGATGNNTTDSWYFSSGAASTTLTYVFADGPKYIDQITWKQNNSVTHGTWRVEGSNDGAAWDVLSSNFTLGGVSQAIDLDLITPFTGYTQYRLAQQSGTTSASPWLQEIEFRIGNEIPGQRLNDLLDVDATGGTTGDVVALQADGTFALDTPSGGGGSSDFVSLTDTPANFTGSAGKVPVVNAAETALEFSDRVSNGGSILEQYLTSTGAATASSSAFATKGVVVRAERDMILESVEFRVSGATPTQTVSLVIAKLDDENPGTVNTIVVGVGTVSVVNPANGTLFNLPANTQLEAGEWYGIMFVRTDGTSTSALAISYPSTAGQSDDNGNFFMNDLSHGIRYASVAPAVSDTVYDGSLTGPIQAYIRTRQLASVRESFVIAASDETTALTTGTAKTTFRMPYGFVLEEVRASVTTAPTGAALTVDINEGGVSILSTKLTIDATEKTSTTAATPAVISDTALADDAEITIDIDAVGSTVAGAGLKVTMIGRQIA